MPDKHILLGVSGGIAAYKSAELTRLLVKAGHKVTVAMSAAATEFVHPNTFQALSGSPVLAHAHAAADNGMAHIQLTRAAEVFLIAPASANTLAKIASGVADNLLTNLAAARNCPLAVAPAMNVHMWKNPPNQRAIAQLLEDGVKVLGPAYGDQACGETGAGRMLEPADLADLIEDLWQPQSLFGKRVLITAGATYEPIDPVRGITNISTGQMGLALARACRGAGALVTLVHGNVQAALPAGLFAVQPVQSAQDMFEAVKAHLPGQDVLIAVAAVADYRVRESCAQKIKKTAQAPVLELTENPDILAWAARQAHAPYCVGFAAESENLLEYARAKRHKKNIPMLVANDVRIAMGAAHNQATILTDAGEIALPRLSKLDTARAIVAQVAQALQRQAA